MPPEAATLPLLLVQGSWTEAYELARYTRTQGSPLERHMAITILGHLAYYRGDTAQAWAMVREVLPRGPDSEPEDSLFPYAVEMLRLATRLALDTSDFTTASQWLKTHDYWLAWSGSVRGKAEAAFLRARLHLLQGDLQTAGQHAREAHNLATNPRQPLALLEVYRILGDVAVADGDHTGAERNLRQALDLSAACSVPYERALALFSMANLCQLTERASEAGRLLEDAREIASALDAAPLLDALGQLRSKLELAPSTAGLSSREVEVLKLVTEGLTDAEAAERLYISPRTVSQHLRSIYNKLGVSSRTAATRVAIEKDLV